MNPHRCAHWIRRGCAAATLVASAVSSALAANALQPAAPSVLQAAQPAFGATAERADAVAAPKKVQPLGLQSAPGVGLKAEPALAPATGPAKGALTTKSNVVKSARNLFDMEDRAIIIVSGKQGTAGELKRKLQAEIAAKAGPPKTVKGGARKLDLAALNVIPSASAKAGFAQSKNAKAAWVAQAPVLLANQSMTKVHPSAKTTVGGMTIDKAGSYSAQKCLDKGPPVISEIRGSLKVGGQVEVWGRCFGDRVGRVEIIGQFPGGKLRAVFASWDSGAVSIAIPGNISGATDHTVAVSVITAEGKVSPAMQAKFVASRERIEVPARLWSPRADFELTGTDDRIASSVATTRAINRAGQGTTPWTLRINPQCALDTMEATFQAGGMRQITGWEQGPANEAAVVVDWSGTCTFQKTTENSGPISLLSDYEYYGSACRVAFQVRAWAYCPVGIAP